MTSLAEPPRSPVSSLVITAITFFALYGLSYFALGLVILISGLIGAVAYFRIRATSAVLGIFLALPIIWELFQSQGSSSTSNAGILASLLLILVLILSYREWLGGFCGLFLGLTLTSPVSVVLALPVIGILSLYKEMKSAIVATVVFSSFGVFFLSAPYFNFPVPSLFLAGSSTFFPNFNGLTSSPFFSDLFLFLLGSSWATSLQSSWVGSLFNFIPLYFIIDSVLFSVAVFYSKKVVYQMPMRKLFEILMLSLITIIAAGSITDNFFVAIIAGAIAASMCFVYALIRPLLGGRPKFSLRGLSQLFSTPAFIQAQRFDDNEGILIQEKDDKSSTTSDYWDKAKGVDEVKQELLRSVALPMQNKKEARKYGVKSAKGVLLYGPPGTGKSTILKGLASILHIRYAQINPAEIMSKWYGESEQKIKSVFDGAVEHSPCILAIDEVDSIGKDRGEQPGDSTTPRLLNIILMGMDTIFQNDADVVVVATSNKPQLLDKALLRPGRFDKIIYMGPPGELARAEIFRGYLEGKEAVTMDIDYVALGRLSERFTGADIEGVVNNILSKVFYGKVKAGPTSLLSKGQEPVSITQGVLEEAIKSTRPSLNFSMLEEYERFRIEFQRERRVEKGWESEIPNVRFNEIGDLEQAKQDLREAFELPIAHPELMEKLKIRPVKGVLLYGPPGNGKTLLAKAVATEIAANFFVISGADLSKGSPADAASKIKYLFNTAKDNTPAVVFIDEIDQIAPSRSNPFGQLFLPVTTQLLGELDGVRELRGVMVLAATNRPNDVDQAILRANRIEKHIEIPNPDLSARTEIFRILLEGVQLSNDLSFGELSKMTEGFSGADIQELINEAKKSILRKALKGNPQIG